MTAQPNPTSTIPGLDDPLAQLQHSLNQAGDLIDGVAGDQLHGSTPCADFDVALLLRHMLGVAVRIGGIGRGEQQTVGAPEVTAAPGFNWSAAFNRARQEARDAWSDAGILDRDLVLAFGTFPGRFVARMYALEMVIHAWDLAAATGQLDRLDPELAETSLPAAHEMITPELRDPKTSFAAEVAVAADAAPYDRLAGFLGRDPRWRA